MDALDTLFPLYDVQLIRGVEIACSPERAVAAVLAAPAAPGRVVGVLMRLRGLRTSGTVRGLFDRLGLEPASEAPREVVLAAAGRPWRPAGPIGPLGSAGPGDVRIAFAVRAVAAGDGSRVECVTRVHAVGGRARRRFRLYWLVVGPFAGFIRREWLRAAVRAVAAADAARLSQ